jgi:hypothetical protein
MCGCCGEARLKMESMKSMTCTVHNMEHRAYVCCVLCFVQLCVAW